MKEKIKRLFASIAAIILAIGMMGGTTVFAQTVPAGATKDSTKGTITIQNAAKGENYSIYKLFDATVGKSGEVAYKATEIPATLQTYYEATSEGSGYVQAKKDAFARVIYYTDATKKEEAAEGTTTDYWTGEGMSGGLKSALKTWTESATFTQSATSDGSAMEFVNLDLGYYVVTTSQGNQAISVDTTHPNATIYDKNTTAITASKTADKESYNIGDTITYTAEFNTKNYATDNDGTSKQVKSYTISDTLPDFLSDVAITSLKIVQDDSDATKNVDLSSQFTAFTNKQIVIPWVDEAGTTNLYKNGSVIKLTYTAKLTGTVNINTDNKNTVSIKPNSDRNGENHFPRPDDENWSDSAEIKTYGAAIKKVDENNTALSGAKFTIKGLTVQAVTGESGVYKVVSYDSGDSAAAGTEMSTNDNGKLYIIGLAQDDTLKVTESKAPDGYNKLTNTVDLTPQVLTTALYETSGTRYYDADGNLLKEEATGSTTQTVSKNYTDLDANALVVENNRGSVLPSTGGIGTTLFYVLGGVVVAGAVILLLARRRKNA